MSDNPLLADAEGGAKIGTTLRIRLPKDYLDQYPPSLRRYDAHTDEMVLVTQEWVDLATKRMRDLHLELVEAKKQLAVNAMLVPSEGPVRAKEDAMWQAIVAASGG
jgi:hypothetical protein